VALAVGERAGADDCTAVRRDLDLAELGLGDPVRDLDVAGDAEPEQPAFVPGLPLFLLERRVADSIEGKVEGAPSSCRGYA